MTLTLAASVALTEAQLDVVRQPWDARALVTAGAGAGKTTTLTYRLEHLTSVEELEAREILVLSFSRAAVRELRERVDRLAHTARRVRAQTFDGWALALLLQEDPQRNDLAGTTFDRRIELATEAIDRGVMEATEAGVPAHVVIDEVQDLVGVRREMVEALLDEYADDCGFTVVGDAAQAVYGFQVSDPDQRAGETNRFFDWVRRSFGDDLREFTLSENFRARTPEARTALAYGAALQKLPQDRAEADREAGRIHAELRAALDRLPDFGPLGSDIVQKSLILPDTSTAILCRDNGQVLSLSGRLRKYGVDHRIQRSPRSRPAPAWIADLLNATDAGTIGEERFHALLAGLSNADDVDEERAWRSLRRIAAAPRNTLDLDGVRRAVLEVRLPDELTAPPAHPLMLSTIHRAKGLEFDRVLVVEPQPLGERRGGDEDRPAEARLLYVAMTRPRDDLYRLEPPHTWQFRKDRNGTDRWYLRGRVDFARNGIEACDLDVDHARPAGTDDHAAVQRYLRYQVRPGDEVELIRLHDLPPSGHETPPYGVFHGGRMIGQASERFRRDLWRLLKQNKGWQVRKWPYRVTELQIDCLEAVAGDPATTAGVGLGDRGIWLAPRLAGMGRFDWQHAEYVPEGHLAQ
ncbi:UvrD-helicase domain-containing protein [Streptomyces sp. Ru72]|uniref:UvrD-helicase domain-containing protein n=1 Tax=Streptomyces sp. Ru72 TaxID=2080747 RepID=UPI000CDD81D5|nr:UvrD-helicase domain-containing protein [Streptomyces sp. Ru72]POX44206.1 DNA helicase [Streptomyces sp. Ru72]